MEDEGDYEVDYEVDDTEEFPATMDMRHYEPEPEPEPELEPEPEAEPELQVVQQAAHNPEQEEDISDQLEELEVTEHKKKRHGSFWKKPPTFVYASNFGFGVNSYQSMIDYLDAKDAGHRVNKDDIHLPLLEERCLKEYDADRPFRWYDNHDIDQYIMKGEKIRTQIRQNDAVGVGSVLRRTHTNHSMTRKWMQLLKNSNVSDYREAHKKTVEGDVHRSYRSPSPGGGLFYPPGQTLDYPNPALAPTGRFLEDLASGFASALLSLVQSRMEHEYVTAARRSKLAEMDDRFDNTLNEINSLMGRIGSRPEPPPPQHHLDLNDLDMGAKNKIRRAEELRDMMDYVNELTAHNSARNTVRDTLRGGAMDKEMLALNHRIEDMSNLQKAERMRDVSSEHEIDMLRAQIAARRNMTTPGSALLAGSAYGLPSRAPPTQPPVLLSAVDYLDCKPRQSLVKDNVISDVNARVLKRAGEFADPTSEQRRIRDRARFVNLTRRYPDTGDMELLGPRSRTEQNIDHMAKSLASKGSFQRRYEVDDELDLPYMGPFNTTPIERTDNSPKSFLQRQASPSRMVRGAASRALARNSLLGY
ncbi:Paramyosin, short form [Portunus trituberculatus]|uniref:Paramyosin, short form n=1 Tax=Portunus trituberculatus TaxID=210409 RepID=A0A5B7EW81_PORTR|nr:Paramyosin, short form [Portunus trituberculatus]